MTDMRMTQSGGKVRGYRRVGKMNESGEELLSYCATNEFAIMNTWLDIHKYMWQQTGKKWHCIDYVIMRQNQRKMCRDVTVLQLADYWTDHRAQLTMQVPTKTLREKTRRRNIVAALRDAGVREENNKVVTEAVADKWNNDNNDGMSKWEIIRDSLTESATTILRYDKRRQPDWFQENICTLKELISKHNTLFTKWLRTNHNSDRQRYVLKRRIVAKEVKRAKNAWFGRKAQEIESEIQKGASSKGI